MINHKYIIIGVISLMVAQGCGVPKHVYDARVAAGKAKGKDEIEIDIKKRKDSKNEPIADIGPIKGKYNLVNINIDRAAFVNHAKTYIGVPYLYGGTTVSGMDCSGFVFTVFSHFGIRSPRSSNEYVSEGIPIEINEAKTGDLILFTGSDKETNRVGHMGIIVSNEQGYISFIHSASGQKRGVMISKMNAYWAERLVKIISVLK